MHLNRDKNFDHSFNLLNRFNLEIGVRKWIGYLYAGISLNYFMYGADESSDVYRIRSIRIPAGNPFNLQADFWPGYTVGFQF